MKIVVVTPGAGRMYCGNCLRDNALATAWRRMGHRVLMVPLYLPLTLDEPDQSQGIPVFFGGVNVFLDQQSALFRRAPRWLRQWLAQPTLLRWVGRFAAKTRAPEVADLTLSMLRGEHGNQARDLDELATWLGSQGTPDLIVLSNALLLGLARALRERLSAPVVCFLAGEDSFIDGMPEPLRSQITATLAERAQDVAVFLAPSRYFANRMGNRLAVPPQRLRVVPPGLDLTGFPPPPASTHDASPPDRASQADTACPPAGPPTLGFFARMCREKGLPTLVEAFIELRRRNRVLNLRLKVGGSCGPTDQPVLAAARRQLRQAGLASAAEFHPNLDRTAKIEFLRSLTVFSVPAEYGEAFGLYLLEALAAGVPVTQPRHGGFPEVLELTQGGLLCGAGDPTSLADSLETLLLDPELRARLATTGQQRVHEEFNIDRIAQRTLDALRPAPTQTVALSGPANTVST